MESTPGEDAVKILKWQQGFRDHINLVKKAMAGFEKTGSDLEIVGKRALNSVACYRETVSEMKNQSTWQASLLSHFLKLPQPPSPSATTS